MQLEIVLQSRRPGSSDWGVIDHLIYEHGQGRQSLFLQMASDKLHSWRNAAADNEGAFRDWAFRLWDIKNNRVADVDTDPEPSRSRVRDRYA